MAEGERAVGEQWNAFPARDFRKPHFKAAIQEAVGVLNRRHHWQPFVAGYAREFQHPPRRFVGQTQVTDLSGLDEAGESLQLLFDRRRSTLLLRVIERIAEQRQITVRPMNLVKIDVVRLQPLETAVEGLLNGFPADGPGPAANPAKSTALRRYFCSDEQLVARLLFEPAAEIGFGTPLRFGLRRYRIHFRHVDEIDAA